MLLFTYNLFYKLAMIAPIQWYGLETVLDHVAHKQFCPEQREDSVACRPIRTLPTSFRAN